MDGGNTHACRRLWMSIADWFDCGSSLTLDSVDVYQIPLWPTGAATPVLHGDASSAVVLESLTAVDTSLRAWSCRAPSPEPGAATLSARPTDVQVVAGRLEPETG